MASTTHSKHYVSSRHYVLLSLMWACSCFILMWTFLTSIESTSHGVSLEIQHKLIPRETLPSRNYVKQAKLKENANDHLNFVNQNEHGEENTVENEHIFHNKTWHPNTGEGNKREIKENKGEIKEKEAEIEHIFHNKAIFLEDYKEMKKKFKIYAYPHDTKDAFANIFLPEKSKPGGNYASEHYFKKALMQSHYLTNDPTEADLFYLPFSIATMRNDKRVSVGGMKKFIKAYIDKISQNYPYWNRTNGADHFYVACHSVGRTAMEKAVEVKLNAIQVVCSSSYFVSSYVAHKDTSIPQIWPRQGNTMGLSSMKRYSSFLTFFFCFLFPVFKLFMMSNMYYDTLNSANHIITSCQVLRFTRSINCYKSIHTFSYSELHSVSQFNAKSIHVGGT